MPPNRLAWVITGFANADGGMILMGIEEPDRVVGVNVSRWRRMVNDAVSQIEPRPEVFVQELSYGRKTIGVIHVSKSDKVVIANDGAFIRAGAMTKAMTRSELSAKLSSPPSENDIVQLTDAVAKQTETIEHLMKDLAATNSFSSKMADYLIGGIIGAILGALLTALL